MKKYSEHIAAVICRRLAEGETLRSICRLPGMPAHSTVCGWAIGDGAPSGFADRYARARSVGLDVLADEILDIANQPQTGEIITENDRGREIRKEDMLGHRRLQIDARKWLLSKLRPDRYGDRMAVEGGPPGSAPIAVRLVINPVDGDPEPGPAENPGPTPDGA